MLAAFANAFRTPDLRKKILFTLGDPGGVPAGLGDPDPEREHRSRSNFCLPQATTGDQQGLYSMINLFSGGALLQLAIFALGIMPYITASIILQLLTVVIPRLEALKKEGAVRTDEDHPVHPLPDPRAGRAQLDRLRHPRRQRPAVPGLPAAWSTTRASSRSS